jgi:3-phosphoshikimate 1-carboxyvinyltransferase
MNLAVERSFVHGRVSAPPSKSHTHREILLAALSPGTSRISSPLLCGDTGRTLAAITALGAAVRFDGTDVIISGGNLHPPEKVIDCGNSGTLFRFLAGIASRLSGTTCLTGDSSLRSRPVKPLLAAVADLGADVSLENGCISVTGPAAGGRTVLPGNISSQFVSSLLVSAPLGTKDTEIVVTGESVSKPYTGMTLAAMGARGVFAETTSGGWYVRGRQPYQACDRTVGGDYSSAAFLLVAAALCGDVAVANLGQDDLQGDKAVLSILSAFGADIERKGDTVRAKQAELRAANTDFSDVPDLFPIVAVIASQAKGTSRLAGAAHLRFKESDRIRTTTEFLKAMGADIRETEDGCIVTGPSPLHGVAVNACGDHRIAMAAAVAGLIAGGVTVLEDADCCSVSYPDFVPDMNKLGVRMRET